MSSNSIRTCIVLVVLSLVGAIIPAKTSNAFDPDDLEKVRDRKDCIGCDLSSAPLHKANLAGLDLTSTDLSSADLSSANLRKAALENANLSYADLSGANLRKSSLIGADVKHARLSFSFALECDCRGLVFSCSNLAGARFNG
jgi:uncharacterized protein YjbI with pentapeptide repeats